MVIHSFLVSLFLVLLRVVSIGGAGVPTATRNVTLTRNDPNVIFSSDWSNEDAFGTQIAFTDKLGSEVRVEQIVNATAIHFVGLKSPVGSRVAVCLDCQTSREQFKIIDVADPTAQDPSPSVLFSVANLDPTVPHSLRVVNLWDPASGDSSSVTFFGLIVSSVQDSSSKISPDSITPLDTPTPSTLPSLSVLSAFTIPTASSVPSSSTSSLSSLATIPASIATLLSSSPLSTTPTPSLTITPFTKSTPISTNSPNDVILSILSDIFGTFDGDDSVTATNTPVASVTVAVTASTTGEASTFPVMNVPGATITISDAPFTVDSVTQSSPTVTVSVNPTAETSAFPIPIGTTTTSTSGVSTNAVSATRTLTIGTSGASSTPTDTGTSTVASTSTPPSSETAETGTTNSAGSSNPATSTNSATSTTTVSSNSSSSGAPTSTIVIVTETVAAPTGNNGSGASVTGSQPLSKALLATMIILITVFILCLLFGIVTLILRYRRNHARRNQVQIPDNASTLENGMAGPARITPFVMAEQDLYRNSYTAMYHGGNIPAPISMPVPRFDRSSVSPLDLAPTQTYPQRAPSPSDSESSYESETRFNPSRESSGGKSGTPAWVARSPRYKV
ncbi:hypothetical protein BXZ70DRAFT_1008086 [Cristinia sonorae]|uniref:Mid2 domain-containing protein n=1 Tax=Cristinia sonorae TaxID=1940300 RepID=A0A8K0UPB8_9AGAR|nr:hypothetical protein BXZ70DRAFT_1008086 [Cristinia sonorae]